MNLLAVGDIISLELSLDKSKEQVNAIKQDMNDIIGDRSSQQQSGSQAVF